MSDKIKLKIENDFKHKWQSWEVGFLIPGEKGDVLNAIYLDKFGEYPTKALENFKEENKKLIPILEELIELIKNATMDDLVYYYGDKVATDKEKEHMLEEHGDSKCMSCNNYGSSRY